MRFVDREWSQEREVINCRCVLAVVSAGEQQAEQQVQTLFNETLVLLGLQSGTEVTKQ